MSWELNTDRPVYIQLMEHLELCIITGMYKCGDKLPSVRELATEAAVNPNTMQKALMELERRGLIYTQRTNGRFITEEEERIMERKNLLAKEHILQFLDKMSRLGFSKEEIVPIILEVGEEN